MSKNNEVLCPGKEVFERMNYLYQASQLISKADPALASNYGNLMFNCAKKAVLRIEPDIKRTICKNCRKPLIAGETAKVRLISKPCKSIKWTCLWCKHTRKLPTKPNYKLWINEPQSVVKLFDYSNQNNNVQNNSNNEQTNVNTTKQNISQKTEENISLIKLPSDEILNTN